MKSEERKMIAYIVACINEFAGSTGLSLQDAFIYLNSHGGIDFLVECYDAEHILSFQDVIDDLKLITRQAGGLIA